MVFINHNSAEHLGGAERSLLTLIDRWVTEDPTVTPIVVSPGPSAAMARAITHRNWRHVELDFEGWAVFSASGGRAEALLRKRRAAAATRAIVVLLRESDARLVVTNTLVHPWGALAAAMVGVAHVWFVREFGHTDQGFIWPGGRSAALRDLGALSRTVVANSRAVRDDLAREIPVDRLVISYPPIDTDSVRALSREPLRAHVPAYPDREALRVCVLGRVTRSKGQWRVVEALRLLHGAGVRVQVCFVGELLDPGVQDELTRRAPAGSVTFVGEQANPFPYVAAAELAVIPSHREAFGRTTVECLAVGRPVVVTTEGAGAELVTAEVGQLVPAADIPALAAAIRRYADDHTLSRRQEAAARRHAVALMDGPYSAELALRAMRDAVGSTPAPLPPRWISWAALLDATADGGHPRLWTAEASAARTARLAAKALRHPATAIRRLRGR